jgi:hypothetical protein
VTIKPARYTRDTRIARGESDGMEPGQESHPER